MRRASSLCLSASAGKPVPIPAVFLAAVVLGVLLALAPGAQAQRHQLGPLGVGGGVGVSLEGYAVNGIPSRRPPVIARAFANTSFNLFGLNSGFNLSYSTMESRLDRSVNQVSFAVAGDWGRAAAGDISPQLTEYSLRGTVVRGAEVEVTPGNFVIGLTGGQAQDVLRITEVRNTGLTAPGGRLVRPDDMHRWVAGARLGYGAGRSDFLHLAGLYVRDTDSDLLLEEEEAIAPAQNLVLGLEGGLTLFDGRFRMEGEIASSALSRDREAPTEGAEILPFYFSPFMAGRVGTALDYAGDVEAELQLNPFNLRASYQRLQPGYRTLGAPRLRNDEETIRLQPQVRLWDSRLTLGLTGSQTRNNLLDTRSTTLTRRQFGTRAQMRFTQSFFLSGNYMLLSTNNTPADDEPSAVRREQRVNAHTVSLVPTLTLSSSSGRSQTAALSATYQRTSDRSPAALDGDRPGLGSQNLTGTLSYTHTFPSQFSLTATANALRSDAGTTETTVYGLNAGTGYAFFDRTLRLNGSAGVSRNETVTQGALLGETAASAAFPQRLLAPAGMGGGLSFEDPLPFEDELALAVPLTSGATQFTLNLSGSYRLPNDDPLRLQVRTLSNRPDSGDRAFTEVRATLQYSHRF